MQGKEVAVGLYLELQTAKIEMNCRLMKRCQAQAEVSFQYFILYNHLILAHLVSADVFMIIGASLKHKRNH